MPYTPKFTETDFVGGKNILASEHFQFIEGGATLDGTSFPAGHVEVGTLIARNLDTGKYEEFTAAEGYDEFGILNVDVQADGTHDIIVGEVIVRGSVYEDKLATEVPDEFKAGNPLIRYVKHI